MLSYYIFKCFMSSELNKTRTKSFGNLRYNKCSFLIVYDTQNMTPCHVLDNLSIILLWIGLLKPVSPVTQCDPQCW